jgi:hypothetical protein
MTYIETLQRAIRETHGVDSKHLESVPVKEVFEGKTVWDGVVEVFELEGHPKAPKAYAWTHNTDDPANPGRLVTVLHIRPFASPEMAVRAAMLQEYERGGAPEKS